MQHMTTRVIAVLSKYMRDPTAPVENATTLSELEIDRLDLSMIFLDIEDAFDIQISLDEEIEHFTSVGALVACLAAHLEAKSSPRARTPPRIKRSWLSTTA
jgi:acyl carrier protein